MAKIVRRETRVFKQGPDGVLVELEFDTHGALVGVNVKSKIQPHNPTSYVTTWSPRWQEQPLMRDVQTFWGEDF